MSACEKNTQTPPVSVKADGPGTTTVRITYRFESRTNIQTITKNINYSLNI